MRIILEVYEADDAALALSAFMHALRKTSEEANDWRRRPGGICGVGIAGRFWSVTTTKTGWSVRRSS